MRRFRILCRRSHLSPILRSCRAHSATTSRSARAQARPSATRTTSQPTLISNYPELLAVSYASVILSISSQYQTHPFATSPGDTPPRVHTGGRSRIPRRCGRCPRSGCWRSAYPPRPLTPLLSPSGTCGSGGRRGFAQVFPGHHRVVWGRHCGTLRGPAATTKCGREGRSGALREAARRGFPRAVT